RRRSSCSDGGIEEPQEAGQGRPQLRPWNDRVDVAEPVVLLGEAEVVRQLLARDLLHDARARERHERARLREQHVAKLASTPPVVGCTITLMSAWPASCRSSTAATVFGSCMRARIPSCMRAPP